MQSPPRPTASELKILRVLWETGPATVRQVHGHILENDALSYTTVLKQLQIMTEKGLVERDVERRAHVFKPVYSESQTQKAMLGDFITRVYDGSSSRMVMQALGLSRPASRDELDKIRSLVQELRNRPGPHPSTSEEQ
ncbi:MAG: BlaI/MecI/CopY family transcriptional regulator [Wenzhouxiangellaceae bacterium]|nr:BlaI/MecI/CopY family transcriptional regulator [Wenzhouxiangellaceae bacterium]